MTDTVASASTNCNSNSGDIDVGYARYDLELDTESVFLIRQAIADGASPAVEFGLNYALVFGENAAGRVKVDVELYNGDYLVNRYFLEDDSGPGTDAPDVKVEHELSPGALVRYSEGFTLIFSLQAEVLCLGDSGIGGRSQMRTETTPQLTY